MKIAVRTGWEPVLRSDFGMALDSASLELQLYVIENASIFQCLCRTPMLTLIVDNSSHFLPKLVLLVRALQFTYNRLRHMKSKLSPNSAPGIGISC
jgi:hypothetical protein